ncbi:hypothetical protein GCM10010298_37030 [Streptomyces microflavus]|nr:hypothetical protein GCM10010298_37030 [Streptomyces microflavus]
MEIGGGVLMAHLARQVGKAEIGGNERGLVVDGGRHPLIGLRHRSVGQVDERAHALRQGKAGGPESGDEWKALNCGSLRVHGLPRSA